VDLLFVALRPMIRLPQIVVGSLESASNREYLDAGLA
jgi:hypothetical protein